MPLFSLAGRRPPHLGVTGGRLAPCPPTPNCVCSDAGGAPHAIAPLAIAGSPSEAWRVVREAVVDLPRTRIVRDAGDYVHAECRSALFGFVDDLELHLRPGEGTIAMRAAARLGYSDLGVNRRRVERLRAVLRRRGVVR